jgi:hypothetical protein
MIKMRKDKPKKREKTECRPILAVIIDTSASGPDELMKYLEPAERKELSELLARFKLICCPLSSPQAGK